LGAVTGFDPGYFWSDHRQYTVLEFDCLFQGIEEIDINSIGDQHTHLTSGEGIGWVFKNAEGIRYWQICPWFDEGSGARRQRANAQIVGHSLCKLLIDIDQMRNHVFTNELLLYFG